jgi:hypothetical protein
MTAEEQKQVEKYIQDLKFLHQREIDRFAKSLSMERKETLKLGEALMELEKLIKAEPTYSTLAGQFVLITNYYCPYYCVPF